MPSPPDSKLSVILPAKNEAPALPTLLADLKAQQPSAEIVVVDDGSQDDTGRICESLGVTVVRHPYSMGNGAAVKSGARAAGGDILVFMDADGQHQAADVAGLVERLRQGYDMVVGARQMDGHASLWRYLANRCYNRLASWMTGHEIADLTSGLRAVRAERFREFLYLLPNGFSYPTTITMAFFRSGYPVAYVPIRTVRRQGRSHVRPLRDGVRFLIIIFKIGTLYSPLKLFAPVSLFFLVLGGGYYVWTYLTAGRFTNMGVLLMITAVLIFLIGLVSEQITSLVYRK